MALINEYKKFIHNTSEIAKAGLIKRNFSQSAERKIQELREEIVSNLLSDNATKAIEYAQTQISKRTIELYTRELDFFNTQYESEANRTDVRATEDAKTLKESVESLLGDWLPDWLKDLLEMLNEILSLGSSD